MLGVLGVAGLRHDQHLLLLQGSCWLCVRGVSFFCSFFFAPGGQKAPDPRKRPGHAVNAPGCFFTRAKSQRPEGRLLALLRYLFNTPKYIEIAFWPYLIPGSYIGDELGSATDVDRLVVYSRPSTPFFTFYQERRFLELSYRF